MSGGQIANVEPPTSCVPDGKGDSISGLLALQVRVVVGLCDVPGADTYTAPQGWAGDDDEALVRAVEVLTRAVDAVLDDLATRTRDVVGTLGTAAFADAVRANLGPVTMPARSRSDDRRGPP